MKFTFAAAIIAGASAIQLNNEYVIFNKPPPDIWSVVKRGERDFQDANVEMAMKSNPENTGEWPVAPADQFNWSPPKVKEPHWAKQDWEAVVKKGNSDFNDDQVDAALSRKKEPILINGEPVKRTA